MIVFNPIDCFKHDLNQQRAIHHGFTIWTHDFPHIFVINFPQVKMLSTGNLLSVKRSNVRFCAKAEEHSVSLQSLTGDEVIQGLTEAPWQKQSDGWAWPGD